MSIPCFCPCHEHPGTYSTEPCHACGHSDSYGSIEGRRGSGWKPKTSWTPERQAAREAFLVEENVKLKAEIEGLKDKIASLVAENTELHARWLRSFSC